MRLEELNWLDVQGYLENDDRLIFIIGACEQHAYLSLLTDVKIPQALADTASQRSNVLVAPPLNFGCSPYFLKYPGTLSLRASTMLDVLEDLIRSAYGQGFRRMLFLNGHGGNDLGRSRLYELANQLPLLKLRWYSWWLSNSVSQVAKKYELKPAHANWLEAFPFTRVGDNPEGEKPPPVIPGLVSADVAREVYGDGSFGGVYEVGSEIMAEVFDAALNDVVQLLKFE
jgi:creatinine amidohydrolase